MNLVIQPISTRNRHHVNQIDSTFRVDAKIDLQIIDGILRYTITPIAAFDKRYPPIAEDYTDYIDQPNKAIFLAYLDDRIAGRIIVRANWNHFAYVDDLAVDVQYRHEGIGAKLMACAINWAKDRQFAGVMVETQNNNVAACQFYERLGFQLAGFDRLLYCGFQPATDEIALFWYWLF